MTTDTELTTSLRAFLEEGADRMPDRVFQGAMDQVPAARRRRTWMPFTPRWTAPLFRAAAVGALVAVIVVGGASFLSNGSRIGSPMTSPTPSPTPTLTPVPTELPVPTGGSIDRLPIGTVLGAGTYEVGGPFPFPFSIALPDQTSLSGLDAGSVAFATPDGSVEAFAPEAVFPDPCRIDGEPVPVSTADEVVAALRAMSGFTATSPTPTTVAGHPARSFVLTNTIDTATAGCTRDLMLPLFTYQGNAEGAATNGGTRQVIWVIDVDGRPLMVLGDGWQDGARGALEDLIGTIALR